MHSLESIVLHIVSCGARPDALPQDKMLAYRRLTRTLRPLPRHNALQFVVLAQGAHTITTLMIAAFHEDWTTRRALSPRDSMALLRKAPSVALVHDGDCHEGDWRELCDACAQCSVSFLLAASVAGGSGALRKPFSANRIIAAIGSARSLAGTAPAFRLKVVPADNADLHQCGAPFPGRFPITPLHDQNSCTPL